MYLDFSSMSLNKREDAVNNAQLLILLSNVIYYEPENFIVENVRGLLNIILGKNEDGDGIENGIIKQVINPQIPVHF